MITSEQFVEIFNSNKLGKKKVLIIGDAMLDVFMYADMNRISPEGQHPVLKLKNGLYRPGGAANVAMLCANLGLKTTLWYGCGNRDDTNEIILRTMLDNYKIIWNRWLIAMPGQQIPVKKRIIVDGKTLFRLDEEQFIPCEIEVEKLELEKYDAVIISDYGKGTLSHNSITEIITKCNELNILTFVDPDINKNQIFYRECTYFKCNQKEYRKVNTDIVDTYITDKNIIVTKSEDGCWYLDVNSGKTFEFMKQKFGETKSVVGAGDSFIAALCASVLYGADNFVAIELANIIASIYVSLDLNKVLDYILIRELMDGSLSNKFVEQKYIVERAAWLKEKGNKIVFVSGCFDLIHRQHIKFLEGAKAAGDILVIGLHTDYSVSKMKGEGRPILDFQNRSEILASMKCVDYIVKVDHNGLEQFIERLCPDILYEGKDYIDKPIVGREFVESIGGKVEFSNTEQDITTSIIIDRCFDNRINEIEKEEIPEEVLRKLESDTFEIESDGCGNCIKDVLNEILESDVHKVFSDGGFDNVLQSAPDDGDKQSQEVNIKAQSFGDSI